MANSNPSKEHPFPAEPSEPQEDDSGTIAYVTAQLARWGRIAPSGMARVIFDSALSRQAVIETLKAEFAAASVPFTEIELPPHTPAIEHIRNLQAQLAALEPGVVSITGFGRAFPADTPLVDSLRVLNFNRENLVNFPLRQIWWMPRAFANMFRNAIPDLDRWFLVRCDLTEIRHNEMALMAQSLLPEGDFLTAQEAAQTSAYYTERFHTALQQKASLTQLMNLCVNAFKPLIQAGRIAEAGAKQEALFAELQQAGYNVEAYLHSDDYLACMTALDAENLNELSVLLSWKRCDTEAAALIKRAIVIQEGMLGKEHHDTSVSLSNLANLYRAQGKYEQALPLFKQALAIREKVLGEEHPDTVRIRNNLAVLYCNQDNYEQAEPLFQKVLAIQEKVLGEEHPDTALSLNNLAGLYYNQGKYEQAEPLYQKALAIRERILGANHPDTTITRRNYENLIHQKRIREQVKNSPSPSQKESP